jgi:hypothetical protein
LLRALVNLDPYTFTDDLAEEIAGENENEQRTAEEILLSAIDGLEDNKLTGFALRLALIGHMDTPREGEFDFLTEAEAGLASLIESHVLEIWRCLLDNIQKVLEDRNVVFGLLRWGSSFHVGAEDDVGYIIDGGQLLPRVYDIE